MLLNSSTLWWKVVIELFMGEYDHSIDKKGRIIIPVKYREELGASVIVCRGFDGCLNVYSEERWAVVCEKLATLPTTRANARKFVRSILAKAQRCEFDAQGRIPSGQAGRTAEGLQSGRGRPARGDLVKRAI